MGEGAAAGWVAPAVSSPPRTGAAFAFAGGVVNSENIVGSRGTETQETWLEIGDRVDLRCGTRGTSKMGGDGAWQRGAARAAGWRRQMGGGGQGSPRVNGSACLPGACLQGACRQKGGRPLRSALRLPRSLARWGTAGISPAKVRRIGEGRNANRRPPVPGVARRVRGREMMRLTGPLTKGGDVTRKWAVAILFGGRHVSLTEARAPPLATSSVGGGRRVRVLVWEGR